MPVKVNELMLDQLKGKHIDSVSGLVFDTEEEYLNHKSPVTGYTPKDSEHFGANFIRQSKAAQKRGKSLTPEKETEADKKIEVVKNEVQQKLDEIKVRPVAKPVVHQENKRIELRK